MTKTADDYFDALMEKGLYSDIERTSSTLGYEVEVTYSDDTMTILVTRGDTTFQVLLMEDEFSIQRQTREDGMLKKVAERTYGASDESLIEMSVDLMKAILKNKS